MKPIGGYFELELNRGEEYHKDALRLNSGHNAFEYILRARKVKKVYLPYYTCDVILQTIKRISVEFNFYKIDENWEPLVDFGRIKKNECFLYINYFDLKSQYMKKLAKFDIHLIIDNSQAFYSRPMEGADTFYSPRKFFGVPDGAYLYTDVRLSGRLKQDNSAGRFGQLIGRIENGAEAAYGLFKDNEQLLSIQPLMLMSNITQRMLQNINYRKTAQKRRENYFYLHQQLKKTNRVELDLSEKAVPMVYPYVSDRVDLRKKLIRNKIFVAHYWPNVLDWCKKNTLEYNLAKYLLPLPIDQRIEKADLKKIRDIIVG